MGRRASAYDEKDDVEKATVRCGRWVKGAGYVYNAATFRVGNLVTAITNSAGEGMLYRIERLNSRSVVNMNDYVMAYVRPVFEIWSCSEIGSRKPKWTPASGMRLVSLLNMAEEYSRLGLFIRDEAKRLSGE